MKKESSLLCVFVLLLLGITEGSYAQLAFPVQHGWIASKGKSTACCIMPVDEIQLEDDCPEVFACEDGAHVTHFTVEGNLYLLTRGKYFMVYGPMDTIYIPKLDTFKKGQPLGIIHTDPSDQKYMDFRILDVHARSLPLDSVFPTFVRPLTP